MLIPTRPTDTHASPSSEPNSGAWVGIVTEARNTSGPGLVALAKRLDVDGTPPALRLLARAFVEDRLYRADRPRARAGDPETSQAAAEQQHGPVRPGGRVHKILRAYADHPRSHPAEAGLTSREVGRVVAMPTAHKRTSELLADGLLHVVTRHDKAMSEHMAAQLRFDKWEDGAHAEPVFTQPDDPHDDAVRNGGRILAITQDGRTELARLDALQKGRDEAAKAKALRKAAREAARRRWAILARLAARDGFQPLDQIGHTHLELVRLTEQLPTQVEGALRWLAGREWIEQPVGLDKAGDTVPGTVLYRRGYPVWSITDAGVRAHERRERGRRK